MTKIKEIIISEFDGGITRDLRVQSTNKFKITKNFDNYSDKKRLIPLRALKANETKNIDIVKFLQVNSQIYGYGVVVGQNYAKIYKKTDTGDVIGSDWIEDQDVNGGGARKEDVFFHYKDYLYFWQGGTGLYKHGDITGTSSVSLVASVNYTNVAQPVHHPADDIAYFFSDNKVHTLNGASWGVNALTLPDNLTITCAHAFGDYLAIGCKPKSGQGGHSIVFLWDRDSSLTTTSAKIDWGKGELMVLAVINDILVGISNVSLTSAFSLRPKIHIKGYSGSLSFLQELDMDSATTGDTSYKVPNGAWGITQNDKLYFPVVNSIGTDDAYTGIWVVGRHELGSPFSVTLAYKTDTAAANPIQGFNLFGDYLFVAHSDDGSVDRTNQDDYPTAIYESQIFTGQDSSQTKKLLRATVMTEPQPASGTTKLEYKRDAETTWTTIFTNTTDDDIRHSAINIESDASNLGLFKEIQFKITSTGGTVITGLKFSYENIDDDK